MRRAIVSLLLVALTLPRVALADTPDVALAEAKDLFRRGVLLFETGDTDSALDYFRRSHARFASVQNTLNIAICLETLGRDDEALEAYDELVATFGAELTDADRASIAKRVPLLQGKVGLVDVSSNVAGAVIVDGRERARLPLSGPIRVKAGRHVVRVLKDGYATYEARVDVGAGGRATVDAVLTPLAAAGGLRVEDALLVGGDVFVDGVRVGTAPWEGTLAPGQHVVVTRKESVGSAPTLATVLQGQTALVRLKSSALGPVARVAVRPTSAQIRVDGAPVGKGLWEGPLPIGQHLVEADEDGYVATSASFAVSPSQAFHAAMELAVDPSSPRWPHAQGQFAFDVFAGYGLAGSLAGDAEHSCAQSCVRHGIPGGAMGGVRGGYELPWGLAIEAATGYLRYQSSFSRAIPAPPGALALDDDVSVQGFWLAAGASYAARLPGGWALRPRILAGFLVAHSVDSVSGSFQSGAQSTALAIQNAGAETHTTPFFATAELGIEKRWDRWRLGVALTAFVIPVAGAPSTQGTILPTSSSPASNAIAGERTYGAFLVVMPQLSVGYMP